MNDAARRHEQELSAEDRARLEAAYRDLRSAVASYERFLGGSLDAGQPAPVHDASEIQAAQESVEAAEDQLWQLREKLLGWTRPSSAPGAGFTSDWFSEEDSIYDDAPETSAS